MKRSTSAALGTCTYSFSDPEGASELDWSLPAEATDPAVCGVLR
jgi:hypothetical protein